MSGTIRFSEGCEINPKDWTEKILLEITFAGYDIGRLPNSKIGYRRWLSIGIWVSRGGEWFYTCSINCDDIVPASWGGIVLKKNEEIISVFSRSEALISISKRITRFDLEPISRITLFREGIE